MAGNPLSAMRTFLGLAPRELPKFLAVDVAFTASITEVSFDIGEVAQDNVFTVVQSVWIDNALNANPLVLTVSGGSNQKVRCPSFSQGVFPVIASGPQKFIASSGAVAITIPIILLNVPQPYFVWSVS